MLDTIVLTLHSHTYTINDPEAFTPSALWALQSAFYRSQSADRNKDAPA
jgi:hypothetical protein